MTIRGGRHGFSRLAELLSYYATAGGDADHSHWGILVQKRQDFEVAFVPSFSEEALANGNE